MIACFFAMSNFSAIGNPARAESLQSALAEAYKNNPRLYAERAKLRAINEQVPQALSGWRPSITLSGDVGLSSVANSEATDTGQHREPKNMELSMSQELYSGGKTLAATRKAEHTVKAGQAQLLIVEQEVMLDVATAYLDVFRDKTILGLTRENEKVLKKQLASTRQRFEVGEIAQTDVHQAKARLAGIKALRVAAESDIKASRATYLNVVGKPPPSSTALPVFDVDGPDDLQMAQNKAAVNNPKILREIYERKASLENLNEVKGDLLPTLDLTTSASRDFQGSDETGITDTAEVTLGISIPLYQGGKTYSRVRAAKYKIAEQLGIIDQTRRDVVEEATRAWEAYRSAQTQVDIYFEQTQANKEALEGVKREAAVGSRTVLNVLDSEEELLRAQINHARAQRDEWVNFLRLKTSVGELTAKALKLPVEIISMDADYEETRGKWFGTGAPVPGK